LVAILRGDFFPSNSKDALSSRRLRREKEHLQNPPAQRRKAIEARYLREKASSPTTEGGLDKDIRNRPCGGERKKGGVYLCS